MTQSARQAAARIRTFRVSGFGFRVGNPQPATRNPQPAVSGQTTAEYAILIGVVVAALVGMQVYVKRGVNARLKDASDTVSQVLLDNLNITSSTDEHFQYEPAYASSDYNVTRATSRTEKVEKDLKTGLGGMFKEGVSETTTRRGSQTTDAP